MPRPGEAGRELRVMDTEISVGYGRFLLTIGGTGDERQQCGGRSEG